MLYWNIFTIVSLSLFLLLGIVLIICKFRKTRYLHKYIEDELYDEMNDSKSLPGKNKLFAPGERTRKYIKKYILSFTNGECIFIANYLESFRNIGYYIYVYNSRKKLIDVMEVAEVDTGTSSRMIALNSACKYVNIVVKNVNGMDLNTQILKPEPKWRNNLYSILFSFEFFLFLFNFRQIICYTVFYYYSKNYFMNLQYNYLSIAIMALVSILLYILMYFHFKKIHRLNKRGGIVDDEFF